MRGASLLATTVFAAALMWPVAGDASCGRLPDGSTTPPPTGARAPLNAQIKVSLPSSWRTRSICEDAPRACRDGAFDLVLRRAPMGAAAEPPNDSAAPIAATQRESTLGKSTTVVITPSAPLAPRVRYEVVHLEKAGKAPPRIVGSFVTGDAVDDKPPTWVGIRSHAVSTTEPRGKNGVVMVPMECAENGVEIFSDAPAVDEGMPPQAMRYAVWFADENQPLDYAAPPLAYLDGTIIPGRTGSQELTLFVPFEKDGKLALPNGKKKGRLGVRAIDVAGHPSAPSEITVKLP